MNTNTETVNVALRNALCAAYVRGWYAGLDRVRTDDAKHAVATELLAGLPAENAAPELLAAAEGIMPLLDADLDAVENWQDEADALRAAIAKAKGK